MALEAPSALGHNRRMVGRLGVHVLMARDAIIRARVAHEHVAVMVQTLSLIHI